MSSPCPSAALTSEAEAVARHCFGLSDPRLTPLSGGRVNDSFLAEAGGGRFVLQRLNDFFLGAPALGANWLRAHQALVERSASPLFVPPIYPDMDGRLLSRLDDRGGFWRLTGFLEGGPAPKTPNSAREAARLLGTAHSLLNTPRPIFLEPLPEGEFTNQRLTRPGDFEELVVQYQGHPRLPDLIPTLERAAEAAWKLPLSPGFLQVFSHHEVVIHGDPKADNFLFAATGRAVALLDWDSAGLGHALVDIAEMLRSWGPITGPAGAADLSFDNLAAVAAGYGETGFPLDQSEVALLPPVTRGLALNLCRRYLTDALAEVYFKWDPRAHPSLYQQNLAKALGLLDFTEHLFDREMSLINRMIESYQSGISKRPA